MCIRSPISTPYELWVLDLLHLDRKGYNHQHLRVLSLVLLISSLQAVFYRVIKVSILLSSAMKDLSVQLTAPNGRTWTQPTGLFINNEWMKSSNGHMITTINPTYKSLASSDSITLTNTSTEQKRKLLRSMELPKKMSTKP